MVFEGKYVFLIISTNVFKIKKNRDSKMYFFKKDYF